MSWESLKAATKGSVCDEVIIKKILKAKNFFCIRNFIFDECSSFLAQMSDFEQVTNFLSEFKDMLLHVSITYECMNVTVCLLLCFKLIYFLFVCLQEKIHLLLDCTVSEIEFHMKSINHNNQNSENIVQSMDTNIVILITDFSQTWKYIINLYSTILQDSDPVLSRFRLECFHQLMNFCYRIFAKIDVSFGKCCEEVVFFGNQWPEYISKILQDLKSINCQLEGALEVSKFFIMT